MSDNDKEIAILICGKSGEYPYKTESGKCADCDAGIAWRPDPEVPEDAIKLCSRCGIARMEEAAKTEMVEITATKQTEDLLRKLFVDQGYKTGTLH